MKYLAILLVLTVSLLAFGCTAPQGGPQGNVTVTPTPVVQSGVQQSGLSGMGYEQLIALGQPVECTITVAQEGVNAVSHAFMKSGKSRIESSTSFEGGTMNSLAIYKDHVVYMQVMPQQKAQGIDCDWMTFVANETQQPSEQQAASETELKTLPSTSFVCSYASFGDEKFDTPGTACDAQQMMQQAFNATPSLPAGDGGMPSIDADTLATICANPDMTAEDKATLGCP